MKRKDLLKRIAKAAKDAGVEWEQLREGNEHTIYRVGEQRVAIPRHREINDRTAEGILKDTEDELGKGWWQ